MAQKLLWRHLTTGIFFLLAVVVLFAALLIVGTNQGIFHRTYLLKAYLPDKQALGKGTAVTLSGLEVGSIQDINLATYQGQNMVEFTLRIREAFRPRITTSSKLVVKSIGVLGDKYLEITLGKQGETPLPSGSILPATPAIDWEMVTRNLSGSLQNVLGRTDSLLTRVERGEGTLGRLLADTTMIVELERTLGNLDATLVDVRRGRGTLGRLVTDPAAYNRLTASLENLEAVTAQLRKNEGTLGKLMTDSALYDGATRAVADADSALVLLSRGRGTLGKALTDPKAYDELHRAIQDLRLLLIDMQQHPERYLRFSVF